MFIDTYENKVILPNFEIKIKVYNELFIYINGHLNHFNIILYYSKRMNIVIQKNVTSNLIYFIF